MQTSAKAQTKSSSGHPVNTVLSFVRVVDASPVFLNPSLLFEASPYSFEASPGKLGITKL